MLQAEQILQERYQLQRQLGRTAAGRQTWLVKDLQTNEQVVVKLLAFSPQMQWEELKLFEREAQVLANLNYPQIPRYRDFFSLDTQTGAGLPWFVLVQDYIPGNSLQELLEQGKRFSEKQVKDVATQVLKILIYLHELSPPVLHRDIKPSNLILGEDRQIYLVDFGAVQDKAAFTGVTFTVVGTSGYAPLEQFWGRAVPASDLYALGATLIHLLTGVAPTDLPLKDSRIQFADRVSLPSGAIAWIEKLTETAVEKRFSTAREALKMMESGLVKASPDRLASALKKIGKPAGSRIEVNKSANSLEIRIPSREIKIGRLLFISAGLVFLAPLARFILWYPIGLIFLLFIVFNLLQYCGQNYQIKFYGDVFEIDRQIFRFTYLRHKGYISAILGIFLHGNGNELKLGIRSHNYSGNYSHFFGDGLSDEECAWLAQEIQDWLNYHK
ncbi:MAG: serine/threonine protein kinase [Cyanosarcina radialis HA8281-LM2]|jgi:serine/threonine protein kinase|nr:serine/threonine protein kinase [Cyanosarcina radialis HA8281-LM2]